MKIQCQKAVFYKNMTFNSVWMRGPHAAGTTVRKQKVCRPADVNMNLLSVKFINGEIIL